jgi:fatty acid synthase subunit beta
MPCSAIFPGVFSARWVGKEAVFKSLGISSEGAGAAMKDIEILPNEVGVPEVMLLTKFWFS